MEKVFEKLVRDGIPDIIRARGDEAVCRTLSGAEYRAALEEKLLEECREALAAEGRERIGELGDVLEVIRALAALEGVGLEGVLRAAEEKRRERGGFEERIFLEKVVSRGKAAE